MSGSDEKATCTWSVVFNRIVALVMLLTPLKSRAKRTADRKTYPEYGPPTGIWSSAPPPRFEDPSANSDDLLEANVFWGIGYAFGLRRRGALGSGVGLGEGVGRL